MTCAGLTLTRQQSVASIDVDLDDTSPTEFWRAVTDEHAFRSALVGAVLQVAGGRTVTELLDVLEEHGIDALHGRYQTLLVRVAAGDDRALSDLLQSTRTLGQGRSPIEDIHAVARLFELAEAETTPTIGVSLSRAFFDRRREQREETCALLSALAQGCDVRIVGTGLVLRRLAREHRADLPGVDEWRRTSPPSSCDEAVDAAREALDPDGPVVEVLREIASANSETRTYSSLYADTPRSKPTIRSHLMTLREFGLVSDGFATAGGTAVDLTPVGRAYLDALNAEIGIQQRLPECVDETGNPYHHNQCTPEPPSDSPTAAGTEHRRRDGLHEVDYMGLTRSISPLSATANDVSVVNYPIEPKDDPSSPGWSYDSDADRLTVSVTANTVVQQWISLAHSLTDGRTWRHVLDEDRLTEADVADLFEGQKGYLRDSRCFGYLPERVDGAVEFTEALQEARDSLLELTKMYDRGDHELDDVEFWSVIVREATGLFGVMVHLLDLYGVDLVFEVRVPTISRHFDAEDRDRLLRSLVTGVALGSKYGHHVAYRQLYETRSDKQKAALEPTIDADDPFGEVIGSWVVVGNFGNRAESFAARLEQRLTEPFDLREDAPEFRIPVSVGTAESREAFAAVVREVCRVKNLRPTREAVSLFHGLARTPYDVADALAVLGREDDERPLRESEVRYALATLDAERLLRDATPTVRGAIMALLVADRPLSQSNLAETADVSTRSLREHLPGLVAIGLVEETPEGYRLALAFHTDDERHETHVPFLVSRAGEGPEAHLAKLVLRKGREYHAAPDDPPDFEWGGPVAPDLRALRTPDPWLSDLLPALWAIAESDTTRVSFGAEIEQTSLEASTAAGAGGVSA